MKISFFSILTYGLFAFFPTPHDVKAQNTVTPTNVMQMTKIDLSTNPNARIIVTKGTKNSQYTTPEDLKAYAQILGEVKMFAGSNIPSGYMICDGRMLKKSDYSTLYETIAGQFGESSDSFRLPNLTDKFVRGGGNRGATGGADSVSLTNANLPSHTHTVTGEVKVSVADQQGATSAAPGNFLAKTALEVGTSVDVEMYVGARGTFAEGNKLGGVSHNLTAAPTGGGAAFSVLPSYIVLSYIIRVQ